MLSILRAFWSWLCVAFRDAASFNKTARKLQQAVKDTIGGVKAKPARWKHRGKLIWDAQHGTYRHRKAKIGRNDACPCGKMRVPPKNADLRAKFKHCCGVK